jgi:uncharacterized protein
MVESTLYSYLDALNKIFVIDDIPAWSPSIRSKTSIRGRNKKLFVDPSIAAALNTRKDGVKIIPIGCLRD